MSNVPVSFDGDLLILELVNNGLHDSFRRISYRI